MARLVLGSTEDPVGVGSLGLPVPAPGPEVCVCCHGPARPGRAACWPCRQVGRVLGVAETAHPVLPVALCRPGDELHGALRRYKDAPAVTARRHFTRVLTGAVTGFVDAHGPCLERAAGNWEALAVVPSTHRGGRSDPCPSPFDVVAAGVPALATRPRAPLWRGSGVAAHLRPGADAFAVPAPASGRRVLLVDDTWVTGARARSAAVALDRAGWSVVAILVVGLAVDPAASQWRAAWWRARMADRARRAGRCCLPVCLSGQCPPDR
jgi:hypothetical protein